MNEAKELLWAAQDDINEGRPDRAARWLEIGFRSGALKDEFARKLLERGCLDLSLSALLRGQTQT